MAITFNIQTTDGTYSYSNTNNCNVKFEIQHNTRTSDTQGYLHKKQIGDTRVLVIIKVGDLKTTIENNLYPMLTHPTPVICDLDRNIPGKTTNSATFTLDDLTLLQEFDEGNQYEIMLKLVEVINP